MNFLVVVCGLILLLRPHSFSAIQKDSWFVRWQANVGGSLQWAPVVAMLVVLGVPVFASSWLLSLLEGRGFGLPYLLLNICILLYAFGRGDSRAQADELVNDLNRGDMQAAFRDLEVFTEEVDEGQVVDVPTFLEELKARLAYSYFERYLVVLFWFLLAGAPLALLYRLSVLYQRNVSDSDRSAKTAQKWLWLFEWLPLRIVGLTLALVGHFNAAFRSWRGLLFSTQSGQRILLIVVNAALDGFVDQDRPVTDTAEAAEESGIRASQMVRRVEVLFFNAIVAWLVVIAVVIILA